MNAIDDLISVADLSEIAGNPKLAGLRIVDCRFDLLQPHKGREEFELGHIPGAVFADLNRDLAGEITTASGRHPLPDIVEFVRTLEQWGIDNNTQVVAYDYGSGALAARLWWMMRWLGHERVSVLDGGMTAWTSAGLALETELPDYSVLNKKFLGKPDSSMIARTDEVLRAITGGEGMLLVDARDAARFRGEVEPIDAVAGHIPGARNLPFARNLGAVGRWRSAAELRAEWRNVLAEPRNDPVVVMCGSGVTACHLVLSARRAGLGDPRLYVGSWSEWIRDPERPVACQK